MKKALKITAWVVGVFLFLDLLLVGLLFVPAIQTFVVHKVTTVLSEKWGTEISIGDIHITPTFKLVAHEVAIKDHHDENMIYSGTVKGRLRGIKTKPFRLSLGDVEFHDLDVVLRTYKDEETINIAKWASVFKSDKPKSGFVLTSNSVDIKNGRFVLINDNTRVVYDTAGRPGIDYAFLELADLDIEAKDFRLNGADVAMNFKQLAFSQYGGFQLQHGSGDFRICDTTLTFDNLKLKTPESDLDLDLAFKYSKWKSYGDFLDSVNIHAAIRPSTLAMDDIAGWAPAIRGMDEVFQLQADTVSGTVNDFRLKNVSANWLDDNLVQGDIAIRDVTHFKDADFDVTLDSSVVNLADLSRFTIPGGKSLKSNKTLNKLGTATVSGTFQGGLSQFNTDLQANTGLGNIKAVLSTDTQDGHLVFDGNVTSQNFRLAKLTGKGKVLGTSNLNLQFDGQTASTGFTADNLKTISAHVGGDLRTFPVLGYPIRNIHLDGDYQDGLLNARRGRHRAEDARRGLRLGERHLQGHLHAAAQPGPATQLRPFPDLHARQQPGQLQRLSRLRQPQADLQRRQHRQRPAEAHRHQQRPAAQVYPLLQPCQRDLRVHLSHRLRERLPAIHRAQPLPFADRCRER